MTVDMGESTNFTSVSGGMVCAHHHLYSALARGMPAPPATPISFRQILELVWWRLDMALDLDIIRDSARLGALEALARGCTAIIDHHESPNAIEGSLDAIAEACDEVGVRSVCSYGVTDRHGADGARRGLEENRRFISDGGRGMVGVHASFTCTDGTLEAAAGIASDLGVGVHIHVAEGPDDIGVEERIRHLTRPDWLLVHGVLLSGDHGMEGTLVHNPRSNMNNSVGYANPTRFANPVALGTDGIGADMLEEFRIAYVAGRAFDVETTPETAWSWLEHGWMLVPEAANDKVVWASPEFDPWFQAFNTGTSPISVEVDGEVVWSNGTSTRVDEQEVRTKAKESARRLFARLEEI